MNAGLRCTRLFLPSRRHDADGNIRPGHPAERAPWIWLPGRRSDETALAEFSLEFRWDEAVDGPLRLHVTADQRYQLRVDGQWLSAGPDRSDLDHWAVTTLQVEGLAPGRHRLEALVWFIAEDATAGRLDPKHAHGDLSAANPPMAQMSWRPGFLLCGDDGADRARFDTGTAPWRARDLTPALALRGPRDLGYHDIGPEHRYDLDQWHRAPACIPVIATRPPVWNLHGVRTPGRILAGTPLPEQHRAGFGGGVVRAARRADAPDAPWVEPGDAARRAAAQACVGGQAPWRVEPGEAVEMLWDFGRYVCGYPELAWSGGAGARIEAAWAEALHEAPPGAPLDADTPKGRRDVVAGKRWLGFGDSWIASGAAQERAPALWWRSGRYLRLTVHPAAEALTLERIAVRTTGYPARRAWEWRSDDAGWDATLDFLAAGLEACAHETWVDCPYYEQMMYVGDTRLHALGDYAGWADDRLSRRALELLDWSRTGSPGGLVAERYPCGWRQESATFAMIWIGMVRDFAWWRDDPAFVRARLPGVRQLAEALLALRGPDGLLGRVPGWPFVDWCPLWHQGCGPGVREGDSSIVNLHLVHALQALAEIEDAAGEPVLADRARRHAAELMRTIVTSYWDEQAGALRDTRGPAPLSEHAASLAWLTGMLDARRAEACLGLLESGAAPARASIYFAFHVLEALGRAGRSRAFFQRLEFWRGLRAQGFVSLPERPEPARSDCHGWGAHPLWHSLATIAGVRPDAPAYARVRIAPLPGPLARYEARMRHPRGEIEMRFERLPGGETRIAARLPAGTPGRLVWAAQAHDFVDRIERVFGPGDECGDG